jgi:hypothetical protein
LNEREKHPSRPLKSNWQGPNTLNEATARSMIQRRRLSARLVMTLIVAEDYLECHTPRRAKDFQRYREGWFAYRETTKCKASPSPEPALSCAGHYLSNSSQNLRSVVSFSNGS